MTEVPFSRQFLLATPSIVSRFLASQPKPDSWVVVPLGEVRSAAVQRDLSTCIVTFEDTTLALFGELIDPIEPTATSADVLKMCKTARTTAELLNLTARFGGRWALYFRRPGTELILHDPCGLRRIFYATTRDGLVLGSSHCIISNAVPLSPLEDEAFALYRASPLYTRNENARLGSGTSFDGCWRLLPNHLLNFETATPQRFFPSEPRTESDPSEVVPEIMALLGGTIAGVLARASARMPVTAGYDSRVLLAASAPYASRLMLYVDRMGVLGPDDADVLTPARMLRDHHLSFSVLNSHIDPDPAFVRRIECDVGAYRNLPKERMIYAAARSGVRDWIINGNAAEIGRNFYDSRGRIDADDVSVDVLAAKFGDKNDAYVLREVDLWWSRLAESGLHNYHPLDLFYWEQRMGIWGSRFPAEQDLVTEEISPFNNRRVLLGLLSTQRDARIAPDYALSRALIENSWPELLIYPFNTWLDRAKASLFRYFPLTESVAHSVRGFLRT